MATASLAIVAQSSAQGYSSMWNRSRSDLKVRLTLRVAVVSALCFAAISAYFLIDADRSMHARIDAVAEVAAKTLELQQNKIQWVNNSRPEFPDLELVAASVIAPALCLGFRTNQGEILQRFCNGALGESDEPPTAFAAFYRNLFNTDREAVRAVLFRGAKMGEAVVWVDPAVLTAQAWREAGRLMLVLSIALPLLCVLVYAALARALRPTQLIRAGLERIAANDLTTRLPHFDLAELSTVRNVFNHLAESLGTALAERNELTRKLIALQDEERLHLARELHDEFGQSLAAIRALAASARQSAAQDCPTLLTECDGITRTATDMMETLRGTLFRLRPPDVDELGLAASLQGLVAGWNGRSRGQTRFEIGLSGTFESLPDAVSVNLYRIVQEALTNAAKHADATRVVLRLRMRETEGTSDNRLAKEIELTIDDDGCPSDQAVKSGMGLLGMRERVAALGGRLSFEAGQSGGSVLRVVIPVGLDQSLAVATECAA
jgi:signal transduction histidine kinase